MDSCNARGVRAWGASGWGKSFLATATCDEVFTIIVGGRDLEAATLVPPLSLIPLPPPLYRLLPRPKLSGNDNSCVIIVATVVATIVHGSI